MRIGVFGGTFDPVHLAHLILAEQCRDQGRLDQIWFIPAARPPHKQTHVLTPFHHRVEMLALAIAGQPAFRINELEKDRPGPSYTVDTLAEIQQLEPNAELFLLLGSDLLADLRDWHEPMRIVTQAGLMVMARPGTPLLSAETIRAQIGLPAEMPLRFQVVQVPLLGIASRDLRRQATEGHSLRYLVPRAVECYIHDKHLYQEPDSDANGETAVSH